MKRQTKHKLLAYVDEGETLEALAKQAGSHLLPTLRTVYTGGDFGQTNATQDRKRLVPAYSYTVGFVLAIQDEKAGPLIEDTAGTSQRFIYAVATDPSVPDLEPEWPGPIRWKVPRALAKDVGIGWNKHLIEVPTPVKTEVRDIDRKRVRGEEVDDHEAHTMLRQLKVAAILALTEGRAAIDLEDWQLARAVNDNSTVVRKHLVDVLAEMNPASDTDPAWQPLNPYPAALVDPATGIWHLRDSPGVSTPLPSQSPIKGKSPGLP